MGFECHDRSESKADEQILQKLRKNLKYFPIPGMRGPSFGAVPGSPWGCRLPLSIHVYICFYYTHIYIHIHQYTLTSVINILLVLGEGVIILFFCWFPRPYDWLPIACLLTTTLSRPRKKSLEKLVQAVVGEGRARHMNGWIGIGVGMGSRQ